MIIKSNIFPEGGVSKVGKRIYTSQVMDSVVANFNGRLLGGFPDFIDYRCHVDLMKVAVSVDCLRRTKDNVEAEIKILDTPMGKMLNTDIKAGIESGVNHTYMAVGTGIVGDDGKVSQYELLGIMVCSDETVRG